MRGVTLAAKIRGVSRALGCEVMHGPGPMGWCFSALDPTLDAAWPDIARMEALRKFEVHYRTPSGAEKALKTLHSNIYRARGEATYLRQNGLCFFCGMKMPVTAYEIDHIESRGRHGRNDEMGNLRACCTVGGCDGHRRRHGG